MFRGEPKGVKTELNDDFIDETLEEFLIQVKVDEHFHNYLMQVLNQQLDLILNETNHLKTNANTNSFVYDPESFNDKELFKYLFNIWMSVFFFILLNS